jgi:uncharacterized membrane protein YhaH (DUF805 family)
VDFMTSVKTVLSKYADFSGRARRSEFWYWFLAVELISVVLRQVSSPVALLFSLAVFIPNLAVACRRLHDTGRSGLWLLLIFAIIVGWIVLLVWYVQDSKEGDNQYGPNPKGVGGFGAPPVGYGVPPYS